LIKGVLSDYGETLVRTRLDEATLQNILETRGYKIGIEQISRAQRSFRAHWDAMYSRLPRGQRWTDAVRVDYDKRVLKELGIIDKVDDLAIYVASRWDAYSGLQLFDDVEATLNTLLGLLLKMGVLSQNLKNSLQLRAELDGFAIGKYFSLVLTSEDAGYDKPDPRLYLSASDLMKLSVSDLCHIGNDYERDVVGARNAGITPILLDRQDEGDHRDCVAIRSLEELPNLVFQL
jgi:putative hydrolase of the HAD superfamily